MKTKFGLTVGAVGAALFFFGLFSGYLVLALLAGYVLLFESNMWLRKTAVKVVVLSVVFSLLGVLVGFVGSLGSLFTLSVLPIVSGIGRAFFSIENILSLALNVTEKVIFVVYGFLALKQNPISLGFIDKLVDKFMPADEEPAKEAPAAEEAE